MNKLNIKPTMTTMIAQVVGVPIVYENGFRSRGGASSLFFQPDPVASNQFQFVPYVKWDDDQVINKILDCPFFRVYRREDKHVKYTVFYIVKGVIRGWLDFTVLPGQTINMWFENMRTPVAELRVHSDAVLIKSEV